MPRDKQIGIKVPKLLLPKEGIDLQKWAVIACDQFTSEPEYWQKVEEIVGDTPSTFRMILPEVYLNAPDLTERIKASQEAMQNYLDKGLLEEHQAYILVERKLNNGKTQKGLVVALDLEAYDYNKGSQTLVRATEGTILDRLPPRIKVRQDAQLELPHIMVLYDDPEHLVLKDVLARRAELSKAYDFELMEGSGHLKGYFVDDPQLIASIESGLAELIAPEHYAQRYDLPGDKPLLYAMGDGNHSLATAKAIWEKVKADVGMDHPARYALVELVNLHEDSLAFEPIHRVIFNAGSDLVSQLLDSLGPETSVLPAESFEEMANLVAAAQSPHQRFGLIQPEGYQVFDLAEPKHNLPVGNLQPFLDTYLAANPGQEIDYVHGDEVVDRLGRDAGNLAFYLPGIGKDSFFKSIILDGALPRKTFSMGHAKDKRFYMECRRIKA